MSTFQEILDDILIKTGNKGVAQNFPVSERTELINEEYIFLRRVIDKYLPAKEITETDTDNNYYDQTLLAAATQVPNTKQGTIRKLEYQVTGSADWVPLNRTSVISYESEYGSVSKALGSGIPTHYIERLGNIQVLGIFGVNATIRIWITDDLVLLQTGVNEASTPRLPRFAHVLLKLGPTLQYKNDHNMHGTEKDNQRYLDTLVELHKWAKQSAPRSKLSFKSRRRK